MDDDDDSYEVDQLIYKVGTYITPYINEGSLDSARSMSGFSATTRNIFRLRLGSMFLALVSFVMLSWTTVIFQGELKASSFQHCYFGDYSGTDVTVNFTYYVVAWAWALLFALYGTAVCVYYVLPIDGAGNKYIPGCDTCGYASGLLLCARHSEDGSGCWSSLQAFCRNHTMEALLWMDAAALVVMLGVVIQAHVGLSSFIRVTFKLWSTSGVVSSLPITMFFDLTTFYASFADFNSAGGGTACLSSNPVGAIKASVWILTVAAAVHVLVCRISLKFHTAERRRRGGRGASAGGLSAQEDEIPLAARGDNSSSSSSSSSSAQDSSDVEAAGGARRDARMNASPQVAKGHGHSEHAPTSSGAAAAASTAATTAATASGSPVHQSKFTIGGDEDEDEEEEEQVLMELRRPVPLSGHAAATSAAKGQNAAQQPGSVAL